MNPSVNSNIVFSLWILHSWRDDKTRTDETSAADVALYSVQSFQNADKDKYERETH